MNGWRGGRGGGGKCISSVGRGGGLNVLSHPEVVHHLI